MGNQTFMKRQKEAARREKREKKAARMMERKNRRSEPQSEPQGEMPIPAPSNGSVRFEA
jgi:hypothetical protein